MTFWDLTKRVHGAKLLGISSTASPPLTGAFFFLFFQVVDPATGEPLGSGKNGEIWIKSALVMIGYAGNPAATAAIIDDNGWLHTGNL